MADIVCSCAACSARFKVDGKFAGKKARCPKCSTVMEIPVEGTLLEEVEVPAAAVAAQGPVAVDKGSSGGFELQLGATTQPSRSAPTTSRAAATAPTKSGAHPTASKKAAAPAAPATPEQLKQKQVEERKLRFIILSAVAGVLLVAVIFVGSLIMLLPAKKPGTKPKTAAAKPASKMPLSKAAQGSKGTNQKTTKRN